jgi:hypothetical protein
VPVAVAGFFSARSLYRLTRVRTWDATVAIARLVTDAGRSREFTMKLMKDMKESG